MKKIKKIISPIICMAVLLFAMTTAVMGCCQKKVEPSVVSDSPSMPSASGTVEPQSTITPAGEVIPTIDRQTELAEADRKSVV